MKDQKGMPVDVLVSKAIAGIEAGKTEIGPRPQQRTLPDEPFGSVATFLPLHHLAAKLVPRIQACNAGCVGLLLCDLQIFSKL